MEIPLCSHEGIHPELIEKTRERMPPERTVYELSDFFKVLGDSTRMRILWALDGSELCVCDISALLGMTKSAVSHQLKALKSAKLVKFRREGKNVFYSLDDDHVRDILERALEHIEERGSAD